MTLSSYFSFAFDLYFQETLKRDLKQHIKINIINIITVNYVNPGCFVSLRLPKNSIKKQFADLTTCLLLRWPIFKKINCIIGFRSTLLSAFSSDCRLHTSLGFVPPPNDAPALTHHYLVVRWIIRNEILTVYPLSLTPPSFNACVSHKKPSKLRMTVCWGLIARPPTSRLSCWLWQANCGNINLKLMIITSLFWLYLFAVELDEFW